METKRIVSVFDNALDVVTMGGEPALDYAVTRDEEQLAILPGQEPTWFHTKRITARAFRWVQEAESVAERQRRAFLVGVTRIDNLTDEETGAHVATMTPSGEMRIGKGVSTKWTDGEMARIAPAYISDVGDWVYGRSFLPRGNEGLYVPPPSSRTALAAKLAFLARAARLAALRSATSRPAATPETEPGQSSTAPPGSEATTPAPSEKPTDAPATG